MEVGGCDLTLSQYKHMYFITGNKNKFEEAQSILGNNVNLEQIDIDLPEIQSLDPREVIKQKLLAALKLKQGEFIVEDVSVSIDCLNGLPGPLIKWFMETLDNKGLSNLVSKYKNKKATATLIIGYAKSASNIQFFEASMNGKIVKPRGTNGFGWDPIFEVAGLGKTLAELTFEEKNKISNRRKAFEKLRKYLFKS